VVPARPARTLEARPTHGSVSRLVEEAAFAGGGGGGGAMRGERVWQG